VYKDYRDISATPVRYYRYRIVHDTGVARGEGRREGGGGGGGGGGG